MQVEQECQASSSCQEQGLMAMSVDGGVAQHFGPAGTSMGEHRLYSQVCSCMHLHQPLILRLQAVCLAWVMITWVDHPAHCGPCTYSTSTFFGALIYALYCGQLPCCMQATC